MSPTHDGLLAVRPWNHSNDVSGSPRVGEENSTRGRSRSRPFCGTLSGGAVAASMLASIARSDPTGRKRFPSCFVSCSSPWDSPASPRGRGTWSRWRPNWKPRWWRLIRRCFDLALLLDVYVHRNLVDFALPQKFAPEFIGLRRACRCQFAPELF